MLHELFHIYDAMELIVDNLDLSDKLRLYDEMEEWQDMIIRSLRNQRTLADSRSSNCPNSKLSSYRLRGKHIFPAKWLDIDTPLMNDRIISTKPIINRPKPEQLPENEEFAQLKSIVTFCPNVTAIHLDVYRLKFPQLKLLNAIWKLDKLTTFTFYTSPLDINEYLINDLMDFIRDNTGKWNYINCPALRLTEVNEIIDTNPNLSYISGHDMEVNFAMGSIRLGCLEYILEPRRATTNYYTLNDLWSSFQTANINLNKLSFTGKSEGKCNEIYLDLISTTPQIYEEIVTTFTEIQWLRIYSLSPLHNTRKLNSLKNLKTLELHSSTAMRFERNGDPLYHLDLLETLRLNNVVISHETLSDISDLCPHLRKLDLMRQVSSPFRYFSDRSIFADSVIVKITSRSLKSVCQLEQLTYFYWSGDNDQPHYWWDTAEIIQHNRHKYLNL